MAHLFILACVKDKIVSHKSKQNIQMIKPDSEWWATPCTNTFSDNSVEESVEINISTSDFITDTKAAEALSRINEFASIEKKLQHVAKSRKRLESQAEITFAAKVPSTIFTLQKSPTTQSERAGQRLHRQAVERQQRLAAKKIVPPPRPSSPELYRISRKTKRPSEAYASDKGSKAAKETSSIQTGSTRSSSIYSNRKIKTENNQGHDVYNRLYDSARARNARMHNTNAGVSMLASSPFKSRGKPSSSIFLSDKLPLVDAHNVINLFRRLYDETKAEHAPQNLTNNSKLMFADKMYKKCLGQLIEFEKVDTPTQNGKMYKNRYTLAVGERYGLNDQ